MLNEEHACARCGRETPVDELVLWTSRERLREYSRRGAQKGGKASGRRGAKTAAPADRVLQGAGGAVQAHPAPPTETAPIIAAAAQRQADGPNTPQANAGRAVQYRWVTVAHAVCPPCHGLIERDAGRFHDHDRRRAVITALAVVALVALIWVAYTMFMPSWAAAFWQNGARGPGA